MIDAAVKIIFVIVVAALITLACGQAQAWLHPEDQQELAQIELQRENAKSIQIQNEAIKAESEAIKTQAETIQGQSQTINEMAQSNIKVMEDQAAALEAEAKQDQGQTVITAILSVAVVIMAIALRGRRRQPAGE